jgi:hypothetical protein
VFLVCVPLALVALAVATRLPRAALTSPRGT